jgi:hypothetical protein
VFGELYILFHFNIILKHNGMSSTKIENNFNFLVTSLKPFDLSTCPEVRPPPPNHPVHSFEQQLWKQNDLRRDSLHEFHLACKIHALCNMASRFVWNLRLPQGVVWYTGGHFSRKVVYPVYQNTSHNPMRFSHFLILNSQTCMSLDFFFTAVPCILILSKVLFTN